MVVLDIKLLRTEYDRVEKAMVNRNEALDDLRQLPELDVRRRELLQQTEQLKNRKNVVSQDVAKKKKAGEPAEDLIAEMKKVSDQIKELDEQLRQVEGTVHELVLSIPNIPHPSVPIGQTEEENVEIRR